MPSDGVNSPADYQGVLDQLTEIITKYEHCSLLLLLGDFNASLHREKKRHFDSLLQTFVDLHKIHLPENYPTESTFSLYRNRKGDNGCQDGKELVESLIDYTFCRPPELVHNVRVLGEKERDIFTCNGSDHHPVSASLSFSPVSSQQKNYKKKQEARQVACWDRIDIEMYVSSLVTDLQHLDICSHNPQSNLEALVAVLLAASDRSVPVKTIHPNSKHKLPRDAVALHKESKLLFWQWKEKGRRRDDPIYEKLHSKKKQIRRLQRQSISQERRSFYQEIADNKNNARNFHKLVNRQRKNDSTTNKLILNGVSIEKEEEVRGAWAVYFEELSTPSCKEQFNNDTYVDVQSEVNRLRSRNTAQDGGADMTEITLTEVRAACKRLHNNKAPDLWGVRAEHVKLAVEEVIPTITIIFNQIISSKKVPAMFKKGYLTPVLKKGKPREDPSGYRGIVVCSILGKLLEITLVNRLDPYFAPVQSQLQCGFTENTSYLNAALVTQEAICDALENKTPVTQILLDAEKAFDVVWHDALLLKMHRLGIPDALWDMFCDWYDGLTAVVKWKGDFSAEFPLLQGTGQGRTFSTTNYKIFNNDLLLRMEEAGLGIHIGDIHVGSPACADDVTLLADSSSTHPQAMTTCVELYANENRYTIGMKKTQMVSYNKQKKYPTAQVVYNGEDITINLSTETAVQLGILQSNNRNVNVQRVTSNVETARKAAYALFGSGLHGKNGLNPVHSRILWELHILPRLIHGLEICKITDRELNPAEVFCRNIVKQLLGIPNTSPTPAVYFLFGILPVKAEIHRKALTLFYNIASRPTSREYQIALRQLTHKGVKSDSWFVYIQSILNLYELPSAHIILANPPPKSRWKPLVKKTVTLHWETRLREEAITYRSLGYLSLSSMRGACTPEIWTSSAHSIHETAKASIKCRLLIGTYPLQTTRRKLNQYVADQTCTLCKSGVEDVVHFVAQCATLQDIRERHLPRLYAALSSWDEKARDHLDSQVITRLMLDCTGVISPRAYPDVVSCVERVSRDYIYAIHCDREARLQSVNECKYVSRI